MGKFESSVGVNYIIALESGCPRPPLKHAGAVAGRN